MTTKDATTGENLERLNENLAKVEELTERLVAAMSGKRSMDPSIQAPGHELMMKAASGYMNELVNHPSKIFEQQVAYWGKTLKHFIAAQEALSQGSLSAPADETPKDPRFSHEMWQTHPYFNFVKQQYLMNSEAVHKAVENLDGLDEKDRRRVDYFTRQIVDMMSPANFLGTNPEALARAVETDGESLVKGLENLVHDLETNKGELLVTLSDKNAFRVGENIGASEGEVVFRNRMFELIQYKPTTEQVYETPLLIFPPWINKFYIMDMKPQNSLIKWTIDQGYTVFVVSWVNPDPTYADVGMDTYIQEGYLTAMEQVKQICKVDKINTVGYCIAGTTLSLTLALLERSGRENPVNSATLFTTLTDFTEPGEVGVYLEDDFIEGIEGEVAESGMLAASFMTRTFSFLRANDLVYRPAIRSYMMGEAPPAFDLLYWNGDGTNLPARMVVEYLRELCQNNRFAGGTFRIMDETPTLKDIKVPMFAVACETDHIALWSSSFDGVKQMGSKDKTFVLSESGHIAGIVNPPSKNKYGHYTNTGPMEDHETWLKEAKFNEGSWWPRWDSWLKKKSGKMIPARDPGDSDHPPLCKAPGTYVLPK
ncbi:PHA/PHB synthase family protein [Actibacterium sp. XHP0104]|uniref:PHA/PHB synthase family protein n=1 Tax=Actibacterium sp. XHP0104 TaxID=2984335 RepID=UPI0021E70C72|nr:class I poly(R)-hydroxyalkanoic acid synthase [Actibacterium sp. XHP0104]MCV2882609.1 class I poly(R)-hydroxyalkanoic acid synthase [Actibacterium sp. XHP0104]